MPWLRVYRCSVAQDAEDSYLLTLELGTNSIPSDPVPATFPAKGVLYAPGNKNGGSIHPEVRWGGTGDDPPAGHLPMALMGSLEYVTDGLFAPSHPWKGFRCLGDGTLTITFAADDTGAEVDPVTCTPAIVIDGVTVATDPHFTPGAGGFPYFHSVSWEFSTTVDVTANQVIYARMTSSGTSKPKIPAGTGDPSLRLFVDGDLTAP